MKILIFAPHPDDDLIGCGGSIAKHVKNGDEVVVVFVTSGESGSLKYSKKELGKIREKEAKEAVKILGVKDAVFLRFPDGFVEYNKSNLVTLINLIRKQKPNMVYIPHKNDAHKDHMKTHELVTEAMNKAAGPWFQECKGKSWSVDTVLCYEVWTPLGEISYAEDITEFMELKIKSLEQHKSQMQDISYDEAVKGLNRYRGIMTGKGKYCECFHVLHTNKI